MGVRVNEPGQDGPAFSINHRKTAGINFAQDVTGLADGADDPLVHDHGAVGDHAKILHGLSASGCSSAAGDQFGGVPDDEIPFHRPSYSIIRASITCFMEKPSSLR